MRRPHILSKVKGGELPHCCIWFDTETDQIQTGPDEVKHVLRFGWLAFSRRTRGHEWSRPQWRRFTTPAEFWDIVEGFQRPRTKLYTFAHNAGFDLPVVHAFHQLPERGYRLNKAVIDSPPVICSWRREPFTIVNLDTLNIWRMPLDKLGEQVGVPKLPMPTLDAPDADWDTYCKRDVEVILRACLEWWRFLDRHRLGGFAPTLAAQALRSFRHRFMPADILIDDHEPALALARSAYVGGRTECFRLGTIQGPLHLLDVNSMYPHVMREQPMPTRLVGTSRSVTTSDLARWLNDRCVVARVELITREPCYPVVREGRLVFPVGRFTAVLSTPEIAHALKAGHVVGVESAAVYERAILFKSYVDELYALRQRAEADGDRVTAAQAKILLNALYGKFGQRGRVYDVIGPDADLTPRTWTEYDTHTGTIRKFRSLGGSVQEWRDEGEARESHPAIAAHVTAHARMLLWSIICEAGRANVYYCDTDSVLVNPDGLRALAPRCHATTLGSLKHEREISRAVIFGPKDYAFDDTVKVKGVRRAATWTDANTVAQDQWSTLVGLLAKRSLEAPTTRRVVKHLERRYLKGVVSSDGTVSPFDLTG